METAGMVIGIFIAVGLYFIGYYKGKANNYAKIESIFNDSDNSGIQDAMEKFYQAWQDCSTTASMPGWIISLPM